jgi:hypothetical protein
LIRKSANSKNSKKYFACAPNWLDQLSEKFLKGAQNLTGEEKRRPLRTKP